MHQYRRAFRAWTSVLHSGDPLHAVTFSCRLVAHQRYPALEPFPCGSYQRAPKPTLWLHVKLPIHFRRTIADTPAGADQLRLAQPDW
jgi:hypothetical protein